MKTTRWFILLACVGCSSAARAQDVVVVANKSLQLAEIKEGDLRAIFTGEKTRFADGTHAVPVILKGGPAQEVFLRNHLDENPAEFRARWQRIVFTGQGAMPQAFDSESALIQYVSRTPGTIGYVSRVSPESDVKSLPVAKR